MPLTNPTVLFEDFDRTDNLTYAYTAIYLSGPHKIRVQVRRGPTSSQGPDGSGAVASVLMQVLTWTELLSISPTGWYARTPEPAGASDRACRASLTAIAADLAAEAAHVLSAHN